MAKLRPEPYGPEVFTALKGRQKELEAQQNSYVAKIAQLEMELDEYRKSLNLVGDSMKQLESAGHQMQRHNEDILNI